MQTGGAIHPVFGTAAPIGRGPALTGPAGGGGPSSSNVEQPTQLPTAGGSVSATNEGATCIGSGIWCATAASIRETSSCGIPYDGKAGEIRCCEKALLLWPLGAPSPSVEAVCGSLKSFRGVGLSPAPGTSGCLPMGVCGQDLEGCACERESEPLAKGSQKKDLVSIPLLLAPPPSAEFPNSVRHNCVAGPGLLHCPEAVDGSAEYSCETIAMASAASRHGIEAVPLARASTREPSSPVAAVALPAALSLRMAVGSAAAPASPLSTSAHRTAKVAG